MSKLASSEDVSGEGTTGVVIIGKDGGVTSRAINGEAGIADMGKGRGGSDKKDAEGDDGEKHNNDYSDDGSHGSVSDLASKALQAVRWLCNQGRLSEDDKKCITSDLIASVSRGMHSQTAVAFSLIIGHGRPSDNHDQHGRDNGPRGSSLSWLPVDMALIDASDMDEFCDICRLIAADVRG